MTPEFYINDLVLFRSTGQDGHKGALTCLACNKDGSLVLTGSVDGCAKIINTATGKVGVSDTCRSSCDAETSSCCYCVFLRLKCFSSASILCVFCVVCVHVCVKVVGSFSVEGGKAKGSKDDEETNSVESVGFCNM